MEQPTLTLEERENIMEVTHEGMCEIAKASKKLAEFEKTRGKSDMQDDFWFFKNSDVFNLHDGNECEKSP